MQQDAKKPAARTTQTSPRSLNLNSQAAINRNYYKQHISAPNSDKYQLSGSNLLNGSYSELHNLPNDLNRSSKRSLQIEDRKKDTISGSRKIQQPAKPYAQAPRKEFFSVLTNSGQISGQA